MDELNIYGESAGSVGGAQIAATVSTVPTSHRYKVTKAQVTMEGAGYCYLRIGAANRFAFYFWAAGQQSEDNLNMRLDAAEVFDCFVLQAGGAQVTRANVSGVDELVPV